MTRTVFEAKRENLEPILDFMEQKLKEWSVASSYVVDRTRSASLANGQRKI